MKKKTLSMLMILAALILAVPAGIADAKATPQSIAFDLAGEWFEEGIDPGTGDPVDNDYDAAVILIGKISEKGGGKYLSPLHGVLALNGSEYKIQVKALKQSEPLYGQESRYDYPPSRGGGYRITSQTYGVVEANIEGDKFMGWLQWRITTRYDADGDIVSVSGSSSLTLDGIADGNLAGGYLFGDAPEIN